jgi:hypothetical protein
MRFVARSVFGSPFQVEWIAKNATELREHQASANHRGVMPLQPNELSVFRQMDREKQVLRKSDRWEWEIWPT